MSDDILSGYGKDSGAGQAARATNGGHCEPKPIPYSPPVGPPPFPMKVQGLRITPTMTTAERRGSTSR